MDNSSFDGLSCIYPVAPDSPGPTHGRTPEQCKLCSEDRTPTCYVVGTLHLAQTHLVHSVELMLFANDTLLKEQPIVQVSAPCVGVP